MYTKPIYYKIYSVVTLILSVIVFISDLVSIFAFYGFFHRLIPNNPILISVMVLSVIVSLIAMFFSYINFSSVFGFAKMIEYENSNPTAPMKKLPYLFPAKVYHRFGSVITGIVAAIGAVGIIALVIITSIATKTFISLPVIPIVIISLLIFLTYLNYFLRYKAFADLYDVVTIQEANEILKVRLKENRTNFMRGYCVFLYIVSILTGIGALAAIILAFSALASIVGVISALLISLLEIVFIAIVIICMAITGCYYDNLAKMLEHYMIKYNII